MIDVFFHKNFNYATNAFYNNFTKKNKTTISIDIKKEICEYISSNPYITQVNVAIFFNTKYNYLNIDRITISKI
jgi:hypothetical protein